MGAAMIICPWEEIESFQSLGEFRRFEEWMAEQVSAGNAEQIAVEHPFAGATTLRERWFRHKASGSIWRLVDPDPPFTGTFEHVQ